MTRYFQYNIDDDFAYSVISLKGEKKYYVQGYASTITKDKSGEIIAPSAQQDLFSQLKGENITLDIEHEEWYGEDGNQLRKPKNKSIPVAKVVDSRLDDKGVWIKAELNTNLSKFNEVWGSIKDGFLKAFSIAFYPIRKAQNNPSVVEKLNLVNITLTGSPVNPQATFTATMKSASAYLDSLNTGISHPTNTDADAPIVEGELKSEDTKMTEQEEKKPTPEEEEEDKKKKKAETAEDGKEPEPEKKCSEPKMKSEDEVQADIKAISEKFEAEIAVKNEEIAKLKAELEKPVMKATVTKVPEVVSNFKAKSPLSLI